MNGVIVLASYRRSLPSLLVTALLKTKKADALRAVLCVSEFSVRRVRGWYRMYRSGMWSKIRGGLGLSAGRQIDEERRVLLERLEQEGVAHRNLAALCRELGVPFHVVKGPNEEDCLALLAQYKPDLAVYTGGGILRERFLQALRLGVLNMHCGPLPHVRGMNAVEWSLYLGLHPAATLHYMDKGIDTGAILATRSLNVEPGEPLGRVRGRTTLAGIDLLLMHFDDIAADRCPRLPNPGGQGRQYYTMAEPLRVLVQSWIDRGITPIVAAEAASPDDLRPAPARRNALGVEVS